MIDLAHVPWIRYWADRLFSTSEGFLPAASLLQLYGLDAKPLAEWEEPYLILWGEAGLGKSTALSEEASRIASTVGHECVSHLALRTEASDPSNLRQRLRGELQKAEKQERYFLLLDGLDEVDRMPIDQVVAVIEEVLNPSALGGLRVRLASRPGAIPQSSLVSLNRRWAGALRQVYLQPLMESDLTLAGNTWFPQKTSDFLEAMGTAALGPLASRPVSLRLLAQEFSEANELPTTSISLYLQGCSRLCAEPQEATPTLTPAQRLQAVEALAAIMLLGGKLAFDFAHRDAFTPENVVSDSEIVGRFPTIIGLTTRQYLAEVSRSGLLTKTADGICLVHRTFAEFLAARFLKSLDHEASLIWALLADPKTGRCRPQFFGLATWLAAIAPAFLELLLESDPAELLSFQLQPLSLDLRSKICGRILQLPCVGELMRDAPRSYGGLAHPGLASILSPYLRGHVNPETRITAIQIAADCNEIESFQDLAAVATECSEHITSRKRALESLFQLDGQQAIAVATHLAKTGLSEDVDGTLRGPILFQLWPAELDFSDIQPLLRPVSTSLSNSYSSGTWAKDKVLSMRQTSAGLSLLGAGVIPVGNEFGKALQRSILMSAVNILAEPSIQEQIALAVADAATRGEGIFPLYGDRQPIEQSLRSQPIERREVLRRSLEKCTGDSWPWSNPLVSQEDGRFLWQLFENKEFNGRELAVKLLARTHWFHDVELYDRVYQRYFQDSELQAWFPDPFSPMERKSGYVETTAKPEDAGPPPELIRAKILIALGRAESTELEAFREIYWWLSMDGNYLVEKRSLEDLPGWTNLESDLQMRVLQAATRHVSLAEPLYQEGVPRRGNAGDWAALHEYEKHWGSPLLSPAFLDSWIDHALTYPNWTPGAEVRKLYNRLFAGFPKEIEARVSHLLQVGWEPISIEDSFPEKPPASLCEIFLDFLQKSREGNAWSAGCTWSLRYLVNSGYEPAFVLALALVAQADDLKLRQIAGRLLLEKRPSESWSTIWAAWEADTEFGRHAARDMASLEAYYRLPPCEIGGLYCWLLEMFPRNQYPTASKDKWIEADNIPRLRDALPTCLSRLATDEAVVALAKVIEAFPNDEEATAALPVAEYNNRRVAWTPPGVGGLVEALTEPERRIVRTSEELAVAIMAALKEVDRDLQADFAEVVFLWDHIKDKDWKHKNEKMVSLYLRNRLSERLKRRRMIISTEVQIRLPQGQQGGQVIDIDVRTTDGNGRAAVLIEVKGSWHAELNDAMETQLINRYLKDNSQASGLYVVAWDGQSGWASLDEARKSMQAQARELSKKHGRSVTAFVLDMSLGLHSSTYSDNPVAPPEVAPAPLGEKASGKEGRKRSRK